MQRGLSGRSQSFLFNPSSVAQANNLPSHLELIFFSLSWPEKFEFSKKIVPFEIVQPLLLIILMVKYKKASSTYKE